ncbi:Uncharacterised protein [Sphingobacterium daejeonense]|nr:Uncharacterised protein [Sphingobacterium daejeonense]
MDWDCLFVLYYHSHLPIQIGWMQKSQQLRTPCLWSGIFNGDDPLEPSDYTLTSGSCGGTPQTVCTIEAPNNGGQPMLGTSQIADIEDALESIENNKPTANGTVKSFRSH